MILQNSKVCEDISDIKEAIEQSKGRMQGFVKLFLIYGIIQAIIFCFGGIVIYGTKAVHPYTNLVMEAMLYMIMALSYAIIYNQERRNSNKYYLTCLNIWGIVTIIFPIVLWIAKFITLLLANAEVNEKSIHVLDNYQECLNIFLLVFAFVIVSIVSKKRWLYLFAIILLFAMLLLATFESRFDITIVKNITISGNSILLYAINVVGYIYLGIYLMIKEKK